MRHKAALALIKTGIYNRWDNATYPALRQTVFGLEFPNPLGMAAGFDKNGEVTQPLLNMGFGFVEIGTITPAPQTRQFWHPIQRLRNDRAILNRCGFNNNGSERVLDTFQKTDGLVGVNIGINRGATDLSREYRHGAMAFSDVADYLVINVSSPNSPGLVGLRDSDNLANVLKGITTNCPVLLKLSPDLLLAELQKSVHTALENNIDGFVLTNTTNTGNGGLSGPPLFDKSTKTLANVYRMTQGAVPLIGVGGIDTPEKAREKIRAGATLIQGYTGFVFHGHKLLTETLRHLDATHALSEIGHDANNPRWDME